ncbi:MAG: type III pantothenate kinase [Candidatus Omnitrophica bacterium]|nr:type III pantothenate kinase [Candidatus Omnitrophota bacterium]
MLLAFDIGNTNISMGVFKGRRLIARKSVPTKVPSYGRILKPLFSKFKIEDVVICSVVPDATKKLKKALEAVFPGRPLIIGKDIRVPIKNLYRKPSQVGQDRLVNAYAASLLFGAPLVVVDFGTAVTFDVISKNKEYLGGMILPGPGISLEALAERTALLPRIKLARPREFIGRDTKNSILSGIIIGMSLLSDSLILKLRKRFGSRLKAAGTGGDISIIGRYSREIKFIDHDLTLKGLQVIFEKCV